MSQSEIERWWATEAKVDWSQKLAAAAVVVVVVVAAAVVVVVVVAAAVVVVVVVVAAVVVVDGNAQQLGRLYKWCFCLYHQAM